MGLGNLRVVELQLQLRVAVSSRSCEWPKLEK